MAEIFKFPDSAGRNDLEIRGMIAASWANSLQLLPFLIQLRAILALWHATCAR
jgi:hypothetical protein